MRLFTQAWDLQTKVKNLDQKDYLQRLIKPKVVCEDTLKDHNWPVRLASNMWLFYPWKNR